MSSMKPVLHSFAYGVDFLYEQVAHIPAADMVAQPGTIRNHPAWVIGHLTNVCENLAGAIGLPPWLPANWASRYGTRSIPAPDASLYEPKETALAALRDARARLTQAVERLNDSHLDQPFPDAAYLDVFPTIRHAITQVLAAHTAYHVGEVPVWRRAMGLPPLGRSFE